MEETKNEKTAHEHLAELMKQAGEDARTRRSRVMDQHFDRIRTAVNETEAPEMIIKNHE